MPDPSGPKSSSDCYQECVDEGCDPSYLGDGRCDPACSSESCGFDWGDCGYCDRFCFLQDTNTCKVDCDTADCLFHLSVCRDCAPGCTTSLLLNIACDDECNNEGCYFDNGQCSEATLCGGTCYNYEVNNGQCDDKCFAESSCQNDGDDCRCNEGKCSQIQIGDGVCNEDCYTPDCGHDDGDCGTCAKGCLDSMINDGTCDTKCKVEECDWDGADCGCAYGCPFELLGQCDPACLHPHCNYDDYKPYTKCANSDLRIFALYTHLLNENFDLLLNVGACEALSCGLTDLATSLVCLDNCKVAECVYHLGLCKAPSCTDPNCVACPLEGVCFECSNTNSLYYTGCVESCPAGFERKLLDFAPAVCLPLEDISTELSPVVYYVSYDQLYEGGLGTELVPFSSLGIALASIYTENSEIRLLGDGPFYMDQVPEDYILATMDDRSDPMNRDLELKSLKIVSNNATPAQLIYSKETDIRFTVEYNLTIENVDFVGKLFTQDCTSLDYCDYCPAYDQKGEDYYNDRDKLIDSLRLDCSEFHMLSLFNVTGTLTLTSVSFSDFRMELYSIIRSRSGNIYLNDVTFSRIRTVATQDSSVVSFDTCGGAYQDCGIFVFESGLVTLLNDGYEIDADLSFQGFLNAAELQTATVTGVEFTYNIVYAPRNPDIEHAAIFSFEEFEAVSFQQCTFQLNYVETALISIDADDLEIEQTVNADGYIEQLLYDHIVIEDCIFDQNYGEEAVILAASFDKSLLNIRISNLTAVANLAGTRSLLSIENKSLDDDEKTDTTFTLILGDDRVSAIATKRTVTIANSNFTSNYLTNTGVFSLERLANIQFLQTVFENNFETKDSLNDLFISSFSAFEETYLSLNIVDPSTPSCEGLGVCSNCFSLTFLECTLYNNQCDKDAPTVQVTNQEDIWIESTVCSRHTAKAKSPACFLLSGSGICQIKNSTFSGNVNSSNNAPIVLEISGEFEPEINGSTFSENTGGGVAVEIVTSTASIINSTFIDNENTEGSGGCITFEITDSEDSGRLDVYSSNFTENSCSSGTGGAIYITTKGSDSIFLTIDSCNFTKNSALSYGSAIHLDDGVDINEESTISKCIFDSNEGRFGTVSNFLNQGKLTIKDSKFTSNFGAMGAAIYSSIHGLTLVTDCVFEQNSGDSIIYVDSSINECQLVTVNCSFTRNIGSSVYLSSVVWEDSNSEFTDNYADFGAALYLTDTSNASLTSATFVGNTAIKGGAAILRGGSFIDCSDCTFTSNSGSSIGGAVYLEQDSFVTISDSYFANNYAYTGSVLAAIGTLSAESQLFNCEITENNATVGTIHLALAVLAVEKMKMHNNSDTAGTPGFTLMMSTLLVTASTVYNQQGSNGPFAQATTDSLINIKSSSFTDLVATSYGAVMYVLSSQVTITDSRFENTIATKGGAIATYFDSTLTITGCKFVKTTGSMAGGAIDAVEGEVVVTNSSFFQVTMGALYGTQLVGLTLSGLQFSDSDSSVSVVTCERCQTVTIEACAFSHNAVTGLGGAISLLSSSSEFDTHMISDSNFTSNSATNGGGIYSTDANILIQHCLFEDNSAATEYEINASDIEEGLGGAVYLDCSTCTATLNSNKFYGNSATYNGGAIAWSDAQPLTSNNQYEGNNAVYGNDTASYAIRYAAVTNNRRLSSNQTVVVPGRVGPEMRFVLLDHYGATVTTENSKLATLLPGINVSISGITRVTAIQGLLTFADYQIFGTPGISDSLSIEVSGLESSETLKTFGIFLRECETGEITLDTSCVYCEEGTYSLSPSDSDCSECQVGAFCYGGNLIVPLEGYWRSNGNSDTIWECPNSDACLGGLKDETGQISINGRCASEYSGNMCHSCTEGYSRSTPHTCGICPEYWVNFLRLSGVAIIYLGILIVMVRSSMKSVHSKKELHSIYFKILMNYLQLVLLVTQFDLAWPKLVLELFEVQQAAGAVTEQLMSIDCLLRDQGYSVSETYYAKLVLNAAIPFAMGICALLFWVIYCLCARSWRYMKGEFVSTLIILYFIIHPSLIQTMFNAMDCTEIDEGEYWLVTDYSIPCWNSEHWYFITVVVTPSILVWGFLFPGICWYFIHRNKARLDRTSVKTRFGFVYNGYFKREYYWEFVILYRKIAIICCAVFMSQIIAVQALTIMTMLVGIFYLQLKREPFNVPELNRMEVKSILVSALTIYSGLYFLTKELDEGGKLFFFAVIVAANAYFLISWTINTFRAGLAFLGTKIPWVRRHCLKGVNDGFEDDIFHIEQRADHIVGEGRDKLYSIVRNQQMGHPSRTRARFTNLNDLFLDVVKENFGPSSPEPSLSSTQRG